MESYIGCRIGSLCVINHISSYVRCYCSNCNNYVDMSADKFGYFLKRDVYVTCGCELENNETHHLCNIGDSYGDLTVVKKLSRLTYECLCKCGKLIVVREDSLINGTIKKCNNCKYTEINDEQENYKDRVRREIYYIWNSYLYLYKNSTQSFQNKVLDKNIKFFDEFDEDFNSFYEWALNTGYRKNGAIYLERIDNKKDFSVKNCIWSEKNKSRLIELPKSILKNSKDIIKAGNLTKEMIEIGENEARKEVIEMKEELFDYLKINYDTPFIPNDIQNHLKDLNNGNSKKYGEIELDYYTILAMLKYYKQRLDSEYRSKVKKGENLTPSERIRLDISKLVDWLDDYNNRLELRYNQTIHNQVDGGEKIFDNSKLLVNRTNKKDDRKEQILKDIDEFLESLEDEENQE